MTDNEPASPPEDPQAAKDQNDVTPLLDVLPGVDDPDAGRHALARPVPMPPDADLATGPAVDGPATADPSEVPDDPSVGYTPVEPVSEPTVHEPGPGTAPTGVEVLAPENDLSVPHQGDPAGPTGTVPTPVPVPVAPPGPATRADLDLDPHPPTRRGWGAHVLGALVGLVVGPVGAIALLLGQSRVLAVQTDSWDADVDVFGIALVVVSALVLAGLVLLAAWTAAVPVTGGVVTTLLGGWALVAPGTFADAVSISGTWRTTAEQTIVAGTSGTLFALGILLLAAGIVAAAARRAGVRLGVFEGRTRAR